tara:strand:- start:1184 stop:1345 length:162 start_codon:yes stop_codon:yes gene_type:complete
VQTGTIDLLILTIIFLSLQACWIIPIINKSNKLNNKGKKLRKEINQLERIYKK